MSKGKYRCTVCLNDHHSGCVNLVCPVGYHNVKSMGYLDKEDREDPLDVEYNRWCELGHVAEKEQLVKLFRMRSGEAFASGRDVEANLFRELAKEFEREAVEARSKYQKGEKLNKYLQRI